MKQTIKDAIAGVIEFAMMAVVFALAFILLSAF